MVSSSRLSASLSIFLTALRAHWTDGQNQWDFLKVPLGKRVFGRNEHTVGRRSTEVLANQKCIAAKGKKPISAVTATGARHEARWEKRTGQLEVVSYFGSSNLPVVGETAPLRS